MIDVVLVVNAGSSGLKLAVLRAESTTPIAATTLEGWNGDDVEAIADFASGHQLEAVGHRVVHGGTRFSAPAVLNGSTRNEIADLADLAPLHQSRALAGIDATTRALPHVQGVACFDTAFHASLPAAAATYAIPVEWRRRWGIRRFGFHGLSHQWVARRAPAMVGDPTADLAIVSCHLGAGASVCAISGDRSRDTTMGFTPLEGLVMATRSGTVDPGLVIWLLRQGLTLDEVSNGLELEGGLLALAGTADMRKLLTDCEQNVDAARAAFDVYVHRLCREIAGMTAALGRLDALVFTGGVGEQAPSVRLAVAQRLEYLGVSIEESTNSSACSDRMISPPDAVVRTLVVTSREDLEIASQVREALRLANA